LNLKFGFIIYGLEKLANIFKGEVSDKPYIYEFFFLIYILFNLLMWNFNQKTIYITM